MGRGLHGRLFWQRLRGQAKDPWPSKLPPPATVNCSKYRKLIQFSELYVDGLVEALKVPVIKKAIGPLHGPENTTGNNLNIPLGIKTFALPFHLQASFHAFKNA